MPRKSDPRKILGDEMGGSMASFDEAGGQEPNKAKNRYESRRREGRGE